MYQKRRNYLSIVPTHCTIAGCTTCLLPFRDSAKNIRHNRFPRDPSSWYSGCVTDLDFSVRNGMRYLFLYFGRMCSLCVLATYLNDMLVIAVRPHGNNREDVYKSGITSHIPSVLLSYRVAGRQSMSQFSVNYHSRGQLGKRGNTNLLLVHWYALRCRGALEFMWSKSLVNVQQVDSISFPCAYFHEFLMSSSSTCDTGRCASCGCFTSRCPPCLAASSVAASGSLSLLKLSLFQP